MVIYYCETDGSVAIPSFCVVGLRLGLGLGSDGRLSKLNPKLVLVATLPNYLIIFYFLGATAAAVY